MLMCTAEQQERKTILVNFALYIAMFPQLIAGPIVRYEDVEQQIRSRKVTIAGFGVGCEFFIRGMVKKVLFANLLGQIFVRIQALSNDAVVCCDSMDRCDLIYAADLLRF